LSEAVTVTNLLIFHTILLRICGAKGKNPVARGHSEQYDEVAKTHHSLSHGAGRRPYR
jgi:hypothetical protein